MQIEEKNRILPSMHRVLMQGISSSMTGCYRRSLCRRESSFSSEPNRHFGDYWTYGPATRFEQKARSERVQSMLARIGPRRPCAWMKSSSQIARSLLHVCFNIRLVGDLVGSLEIISVPDAPHCIAAISSSDGSFARDGLFVVGVERERECVCVW